MSLEHDLEFLCYDFLCNEGFNKSYDSKQQYLLLWLNREARKIINKPRKVLFSKEFQRPNDPTLSQGLNYLLSEVRSGGDLYPFMSRRMDIKRYGVKFDALLNDWNIHHFHMDTQKDKNGFIKGNKEILFAWVDYDNFYCIQIMDHDSFSDEVLVNIVENNWPELLNDRRVDCEVNSVSQEERDLLRKNHINLVTQLDDGRVITPINLGSNCAGGQVMCNGRANLIVKQLRHLEKNYLHDTDFFRKLMQDGFSPELFLKTPLWHLHNFSLSAQYEVDDLSNGVRYCFDFLKIDSGRICDLKMSILPWIRERRMLEVLSVQRQYKFDYNIGL